MLRISRLLSGFALVVLGALTLATPAAADDPPVVTTLAAQRVELLPQEPLCWNAFRLTLPPGVRVPAQGYLSAPLAVNYLLEGQVRSDYAGGSTTTHRAGEGGFIGAGNWFATANTGAGPVSSLSFVLTCRPYPTPGTPGVTPIGTARPLTGFEPGTRPHQVTFRTGSSSAGSQGPVVSHGGPVLYYVLEGSTAISTAAGVARYQQGETFAIPQGTPYQYTNVGAGINRSLYVLLTPADEPVTQVYPDLRLPQPALAGLPRTGELTSQAPQAVLLSGALLLAWGLLGTQRRRR